VVNVGCTWTVEVVTMVKHELLTGDPLVSWDCLAEATAHRQGDMYVFVHTVTLTCLMLLHSRAEAAADMRSLRSTLNTWLLLWLHLYTAFLRRRTSNLAHCYCMTMSNTIAVIWNGWRSDHVMLGIIWCEAALTRLL
jgi:hypothetical protein